ncbi:MAG: helix-turn-helix domain-containing protein, partial [Microcystis aeruginosa]
RNIAEWLEDAGYKRDFALEYDASDSISFIVVKRANIKIEKNQLMIDVNIRLATPLPSEMSAINIENREEENH